MNNQIDIQKIFLIVVLCLSLTTGFGPCDKDTKNPTGPVNYTTFSEAVNGLDTPSKVVNYMGNNFTFEYHDGCVSYDPDYFFELKRGDCKDYATFFSYIVAQHGYYAEIVTFTWYDQQGQRNGHVVTIFQDTDGVLKYQSNDFIAGQVASVSDLLEKEKLRLNASSLGGYRVVPAGSTDCCSPN